MKIGYLPGVFDLLHHGHINIINKTIEACDVTVIGIHTDDFVAHYKRRPVQTQDERLEAVKNYFGSKVYALEIIGSKHLGVIQKHGITHIFHGTDWELTSYKKQIRYYEDGLDKLNIQKNKVPYIVGNIDLMYPNKNTILPDTGSIYHLINSITKISPILMCGKPFLNGIDTAIDQDKKYLLVGDSLLTDGKLAENLNIPFYQKLIYAI